MASAVEDERVDRGAQRLAVGDTAPVEVRQPGTVEGVSIPDAGKAVNSYPIAAVRNAPDPAVAKAFVAYVLSPSGREVLRSYGFGSP